MSQKIKIRVKKNETWNTIVFPETTLDQIVGLSATSQKILRDLEAPSIAGDYYLKIDSDGSPNLISSLDFIEEVGAAPKTHTHTMSQIEDLEDIMGAKAGVNAQGILETQHIPDWLFGGLRFKKSLSSATLNLTTEYQSTLELQGDITEIGYYFIVTANSITITAGDKAVFKTTDETEVDGTAGEVVTLEKGDWLVYRGKENNSNPVSTSNKLQFDIVNNVYELAKSTYAGVVKLTNHTTIEDRASLAASNPVAGESVVTERVLKKVMKEIHYGATEPTNSQNGDIWFDSGTGS